MQEMTGTLDSAAHSGADLEGTRSFIQAGHIKTAYYRKGNGKPLILVHGGGAGADSVGNWQSCVPLLARHFDVIAVDMVGFGRSEKPNPAAYKYDQEARTRQMAEFIKALGLGPVYLVGNSMGGLTSLEVAARHPDLIAALLLMGSAGIQTPTSPALQAILNYDFSRDGMRTIIKSLTNDHFKIDESMVDYRHKLSIEPDTKAAYTAQQGWIRERKGLYTDEAVFRAVRVPTLIVSGKEDKVVPVTSAYRMLELIPHAWGKIFPRCGHWAMIEHPQAFCGTVMQFFDDTGI
jgi:2-hydroxy-6-oxo-6-(2'-aminophenyl)hexa-2,4-dienoate hydrolase